MSRDAVLLIVIGAIVVVLLGAAFLGLAGTTHVTTSSSGTAVAIQDPPRDGASGIVFDLREQEGQSLFGIRLTASDYLISVGIIVPDGCLVTDGEGREVLADAGDCADVPVRGEVTGSGTTARGDSLAIISIEVSRACFEALAVGDAWPAEIEVCRGE